jgi:hypothetical protein
MGSNDDSWPDDTSGEVDLMNEIILGIKAILVDKAAPAKQTSYARYATRQES